MAWLAADGRSAARGRSMSERPFLGDWRDALLDSEVDKTAILVGLVLSTFAKASGSCHPGKERLAADSRLSKRGVDGAIDRLSAAGFLIVSRSRGRSSNGYQLTLPTLQVAARLNSTNPAARTNQPCRNGSPTLQVAAPESAESAESVANGRASLDARSSIACPECEVVPAINGHADWCSQAVKT